MLIEAAHFDLAQLMINRVNLMHQVLASPSPHHLHEYMYQQVKKREAPLDRA